jgi:hypothetical protein
MELGGANAAVTCLGVMGLIRVKVVLTSIVAAVGTSDSSSTTAMGSLGSSATTMGELRAKTVIFQKALHRR